MANEADKQLRANTREVLESFWKSVKVKLDAGDAKTMELVGRMFQYDKGPGGVTIFNQHLQLNGNSGQSGEQTARVRSFDQIIGKLEEQDEQRLLLAQPEEEIEDAETEDIPEAQAV